MSAALKIPLRAALPKSLSAPRCPNHCPRRAAQITVSAAPPKIAIRASPPRKKDAARSDASFDTNCTEKQSAKPIRRAVARCRGSERRAAHIPTIYTIDTVKRFVDQRPSICSKKNCNQEPIDSFGWYKSERLAIFVIILFELQVWEWRPHRIFIPTSTSKDNNELFLYFAIANNKSS